MNQQFLRFYLPSLFVGILGTLLKIPLAQQFLMAILVLGLSLIAVLALKLTWKWWRAPATDPVTFNFPYSMIFYGTSASMLLCCMLLVL